MMTTRKLNLIVSLSAIALGLCLATVSTRAFAATINIDGMAGSIPYVGGDTVGTISGFTVANNENRALVVTIGGEVSNGVTSVTYGSQSFTEAGTAIFAGNTMASVWYLLNPTATTDDINVNRTAAGNGWAFGAISLSNVEQQAPVTAIFSAGDSANPSVSLTTNSNNSLIVEALGRNEIGANTPNSGQSIFFSSLVINGGAGVLGSTDVIPVAGLTVQSWNISGSTRTPLVAAAFDPFVPPAPEPSSLMLLGLGGLGLVRYTRRRAGRS